MFDLVLNKDLIKPAKSKGLDAFFIEKKQIIHTDNLDELMRKISSFSSKGLPVIVKGSTDDINRKAVEDKRVDMLLSPELIKRKDSLHRRNTGLTQVLCKFATKNNVKIGIDFSSISSLNPREKANRIGRIIQNVIFCRKYHTKMLIASFSESERDLVSVHELRSFCSVLGMTPSQAKESLVYASEIFRN